ncbi:MAG: RluA family pseudouridine synthase [Chlamydiia bacterium]|nr:RluA family pseudouridine synthase [Chlamydiia bacterium]
MEYRVPAPMKALEALRHLFPDSSRRTLQNWIRGGRFQVDGEKLSRDDQSLLEGQVVSSHISFSAPKIPGITILYEDRYMIAIDKPKGLLSVPLDGEHAHRHALGLLRRYLGTEQIFAVHRIDRETSGVLLFARGKESEEKLKDLFERHDIERHYFAIVEGHLKESHGTWNVPLKELASYDVVAAPDGKPAVTHFEVERRSPKYTYLRLRLETGRKHQIRVHCQLAGHPVLGDRRYGSTENPIGRMCLHSLHMEFKHPFTEKMLSFNSPIPKQFKKMMIG